MRQEKKDEIIMHIEEKAKNTKSLSGDPDIGFSRKDINSAI